MVCVYEFVVDVLSAYMNSEEYTRNIALGLDEFEVIIQDKEILDMGLYGFSFQHPFSDGWEGLTVKVTADYYTKNNLNIPTIELDCCIVILENVWFCDIDESEYYFYDGLVPFNSFVEFNNKNIYFDDFSRYYFMECKDCNVFYRGSVFFNNFKGKENEFRKHNKFYFSNFVFNFKFIKTHEELWRYYYLAYEALNNYQRNCKMDMVTVVLEFPVFAYKEERLSMFRNYLFKKIKLKNKYLTEFCSKIHFQIIRNGDMDKNDYMELCEDMKQMGILTSYEIKDADYLKINR